MSTTPLHTRTCVPTSVPSRFPRRGCASHPDVCTHVAAPYYHIIPDPTRIPSGVDTGSHPEES
eukprot:2533838-Pyramimonas_sp.AAC.1